MGDAQRPNMVRLNRDPRRPRRIACVPDLMRHPPAVDRLTRMGALGECVLRPIARPIAATVGSFTRPCRLRRSTPQQPEHDLGALIVNAPVSACAALVQHQARAR